VFFLHHGAYLAFQAQAQDISSAIFVIPG